MSASRPAIVYVTRRATFAAAHRLWREDLSREENYRLYGPCAHEFGHGHNYTLEVTLRGPVNPATGMVFDLAGLKEILRSEILAPFDHHHFNHDVPLTRGVNPTAENLAVLIWRQLAARLPAGLLHEVRLRETENNISIYRGP